jgi:DNA-binding IclR family transcriptional regulator
MSRLETAAAVLRSFALDRPELTVTATATLLAMPKGNASRLLRAMRAVGLLETVGSTKRYRPGTLLLELADIYRRSSPLVARADAIVGQLAAAVGHSGYVSVRDGRDMIGVTYHPGRQVLRVTNTIGMRIPAFASATGRALLARLPDAAVRALHADGLAPPSPTAPQSLDELLARLAEVRRRGYAQSHDEAVRGVGAIAVAAADAATGEAVSLCITYPASTVTEAERRAIIAGLTEGAAAIEAMPGERRAAAIAAQ